jgi:transglutaminase-like putative cysteine protease
MKLLKFVIALSVFATFAGLLAKYTASSAGGPPVRTFAFTYVTKIPVLPANAKASRVWIPLPQSGPYQIVRNLKIEAPFAYVKQREPEYDNEYLYLQIPAAKLIQATEIRVTFEAARQEHRVSLRAPIPSAQSSGEVPPDVRRFLEPDRLVPLQGVIAELSARETRGITGPLAKARAIYDFVLSTMRYDKSGTGWGNGDAVWACSAKRGNCTDFHSLFIGMVRAAGIPARFEIGFPLPTDRHDGPIPGYHCWAEFYVQPYGWIPVDASEAWKHPDQKDYFFGAHDDNRLQFTLGRDIRLNPPQQGAALNYFIYPYAELDGNPLALESTFSFHDQAGTT